MQQQTSNSAVTIPIPYIHHATSLNCINHIQNSISQGTNALPEKFQPVQVPVGPGKAAAFPRPAGFFSDTANLFSCSGTRGAFSQLCSSQIQVGRMLMAPLCSCYSCCRVGSTKPITLMRALLWALSSVTVPAHQDVLPLGQHPPQGNKSRAASVLAFCMGQMNEIRAHPIANGIAWMQQPFGALSPSGFVTWAKEML